MYARYQVNMVSLAIINTWLLTMHGPGLGIVENGTLAVENETIVYAGPSDGFNPSNADSIIDGTNHVTMPGLVNTHFHSGMTLLRGGAQDMPEIEWMNRGVGPLGAHVNHDDSLIGSKLAVVEGLRSGTTTFAEYGANVARLVESVYRPFGVRVVATESINEISSNRSHLKPSDLYEFDPLKGNAALKQAEQLFENFRGEDLDSCMYGPQALDMMSVELLTKIRDRAVFRGSTMHLHLAQGGRERLQIQGRYGADVSTVSLLRQHDLLGDFLIGAHCHDTDAPERELMADARVSMASCQSSISMLDGIVPPLSHYVEELGGTAGLGTDQAPGPGSHNMFREMRPASLLAKVTHQDPTRLPAWKSLELATIAGARVLDLDDIIGSLEAGKRADLITINLHHPNLSPTVSQPFRNFVPNLVYSASGTEVDNVFINGRQVMAGGKLSFIDESSLLEEADERASLIFARAEADWRNAGSMLVRHVDQGHL